MKKIFLLWLCLYPCLFVYSQVTFTQTYDFNDGNPNYEANAALGCVAVNNGFILSAAASYNIGTAVDVMRINNAGNLIWRTRVKPDNATLLLGFGNILLKDSTLFIKTGYFPDSLNALSYAGVLKMNVQGDTLWHKLFGIRTGSGENDGIVEMQGDTLAVGNTVAGTVDHFHPKITRFLASTGTKVDDTICYNIIYGSAINLAKAPNNAIALAQIIYKDNYSRYTRITCLDTNLDTVWNFEPPKLKDTYWTTNPIIRRTQDHNYAVLWGRDSIYPIFHYDANHWLFGLDSLGKKILWEHHFPSYFKKEVLGFRQVKNGDFFGCGVSKNPIFPETANWLFRLSPTGKSLWDREYFFSDLYLEYNFDQGEIFDVAETDDGDLVVVGTNLTKTNNYYHYDIFVLKVDSSGCLTPGCTDSILFVGINPNTQIVIEQPFPLVVLNNNGANSITLLTANRLIEQANTYINIYNLYGKLVYKQPLNEFVSQKVKINTELWASGLYIAALFKDNKKLNSTKFIITH